MRWQVFGEREDGAAGSLRGEATGPVPDSDAAFWGSPVGRAARAMLRGDRFFQIELDDATLSAYAEIAAPAHGRRARRTYDLLGQIEELGWHLEHVTWWRSDTEAPPPPENGTQLEPGEDHVRGVYLFHSLPGVEVGHHVRGSVAEGHAPTHRRAVL